MTSRKTKQDELIDQLLEGCSDPQEILGKKGLLDELQKRFVGRVVRSGVKPRIVGPLVKEVHETTMKPL